MSLESLLSIDLAEREEALALLVKRGDDPAVDIIGRALLASSWPVCDQLAESLGTIGGQAATEALIRALCGRRHHIRSAAVKSLAMIGGNTAREEIAKLADDPSFGVRQDVAQALRELDSS